jgi:hypothetical protein
MEMRPVGTSSKYYLPVINTGEAARKHSCFLPYGHINKLGLKNTIFMLSSAIKTGHFIPCFKQAEAEEAFTQILNEYGDGRYAKKLPDNLDEWIDLLENRGTALKTSVDWMKKGHDPLNPKIAQTQEIIQTAMGKLKAIEDWFYYHPAELRSLASLVKSFVEEPNNSK